MENTYVQFDQKADRDLRRRVATFLASRRQSLRRLQVETADGVVTIRGEVKSFHEKQLAIHCCQRVAGVHRLVDQVKVA